MAASDIAKTAAVTHLAGGQVQTSFARFVGTLGSGWGLLCFAVAVYWLFFFGTLLGEWQINPQYNYGYAVPLLSAMLIWRRWPGRPSPAVPEKSWLATVFGALLLFEFLPLRLILEANPEWRLMYWLNALQVLGLSAWLLYQVGGWCWVTYFAPPLLFALVAVPWPMGLETAVIQGLMRWVAGLTVELTGWLGIPALQQGNLIEVSNGIVGIDEACSGVRSLQSGLMLSLFLGEMHRFRILRRWWLVAASLVFVLLANLVRTSFLVWAAASRGLAQMEAWHNSAGVMVMLVVLPGLLLLAHLMRPRTKPVVATSSSGPPVFPAVSLWVG